jgi:hypothetical protein
VLPAVVLLVVPLVVPLVVLLLPLLVVLLLLVRLLAVTFWSETEVMPESFVAVSVVVAQLQSAMQRMERAIKGVRFMVSVFSSCHRTAISKCEPTPSLSTAIASSATRWNAISDASPRICSPSCASSRG